MTNRRIPRVGDYYAYHNYGMVREALPITSIKQKEKYTEVRFTETIWAMMSSFLDSDHYVYHPSLRIEIPFNKWLST